MDIKKRVDYYVDISGRDNFDRPKAHVALNFSFRYNDGTSLPQQELMIPLKPVVKIFKHAGFVNVLLDFQSRDDNDLAMAWNLLSEYSKPENSIDWTEEEIDSGVYLGEDGKTYPIYFPVVELILSPFGREREYLMHGLNPALFTLQPNEPKGPPCVLQLTFAEDWFFIDTDIDPVNMEELRRELAEELGMEHTTAMNPSSGH